MAAVRATDTAPELKVRRALHAAGLRYRLHRKDLPGKPDIVLPKYQAVIFVHGCFWHGHDCYLFRWPSTRVDFWRAKIDRNIENDQQAQTSLRNAGLRVGVVWECALKGRKRPDFDEAIQNLLAWLLSQEPLLTIRGKD